MLTQVEKDIDFQVSTEAIHLRYLSKTSTPGASLTYSVGVGTTAGMDDVKAFGSVDMSDVINVEGLNLQFNMVSAITHIYCYLCLGH